MAATGSFTHLHTHTEYSMLDGASRLDDLVAAAVADGQPALGITDHGNMYGVLDFYAACRNAGINPVIGTEAYMAGESRHERPVRRGKVDDTGGDVEGGEKLYYHLTLLAETTQGYRNLLKLSSAAYLEGYYYKPRVDWELLERHHEGIIATTGCLGGVVLQALLADDEERALKLAGRLQDVFGRDNLFVELQDHGLPQQTRTNPALVRIARQLGAPLLATNDSHYTHREDSVAHDALLCVQTGALIDDPKRFKFEGEEHYLKSAAEMRALFSELPEACDNTLLIAERADVEIEFGVNALPEFPVPDGVHRRHLRAAGRRLSAPPDPDAGGEPLRVVAARRGARAHRLRARRHRQHGVLGLLPRGLGPDPPRPGKRDPGGARAGLGGGVLRGLLPRDRGPRPHPLRPALRAVLEPRAQADARHRHGLRRAVPGGDDPLRHRALRRGPCGADRDLLDDQGTGRGARRGARASAIPTWWATGSPRPCRRSSWAATPRCGRVSTASTDSTTGTPRPRACARCTPPTKRPAGSSTWPRASRACAARTASTPRRWSSPRSRSPSTCPSSASPRAGRTPPRRPSSPSTRCTGWRSSGCSRWTSSGCATCRSSSAPSTSWPRPRAERPDIDAIPLDDPATFAMLQRGDSIGVFQLEGGPMRSLMRSLAPTGFDDVAALVALYRPGPMAANMHRDYAGSEEQPPGRQLPPRRSRAHPGRHLRAHDLPGVGHAGGPALRRLHPRGGRQPPQGVRQEDPRHDPGRAREVRGGVRDPGLREGARHQALRHHRALRRLRLQQVPLLRLRTGGVPDRVAQGPLPGGVLRRLADLGQRRQGQDRRSTSASAGRWASRCSSPTSTARPASSPRSSAKTARIASCSAWRPCATWGRASWTGSWPNARPTGRSPTSTTSASASTPWCSTSGPWSRSSSRARSTHSPIPARVCAWCSRRSWTGPSSAGARSRRGSPPCSPRSRASATPTGGRLRSGTATPGCRCPTPSSPRPSAWPSRRRCSACT